MAALGDGLPVRSDGVLGGCEGEGSGADLVVEPVFCGVFGVWDGACFGPQVGDVAVAAEFEWDQVVEFGCGCGGDVVGGFGDLVFGVAGFGGGWADAGGPSFGADRCVDVCLGDAGVGVAGCAEGVG